MQERIRAIVTEGRIQPLEDLNFPEGTEVIVARAEKEAMPENQGQPAALITAQLKLRDGTLEVTAQNIGENATRVSETIKRGGAERGRRNERCRVKLCLYLNLAYSVLWGGEPNWNIVSENMRADYETRFAAAESRDRVEVANGHDFWLSASAPSMEAIWGNPEDDIYAELLQR